MIAIDQTCQTIHDGLEDLTDVCDVRALAAYAIVTRHWLISKVYGKWALIITLKQ